MTEFTLKYSAIFRSNNSIYCNQDLLCPLAGEFSDEILCVALIKEISSGIELLRLRKPQPSLIQV